jgi:hypothetical protein
MIINNSSQKLTKHNKNIKTIFNIKNNSNIMIFKSKLIN